MKTKKNRILTPVILVVVTELIGMLSAFAAGNIKSKYILMEKAPLSPPPAVFGVVWPILYLLMALALFFALTSDDAPKKQGNIFISLYIAQLALNFVWSPLFFGNGLLWPAFAIVLLMDAVVLITILLYVKYVKLSAILLTPYLLWLLFATYLNISFAILN